MTAHIAGPVRGLRKTLPLSGQLELDQLCRSAPLVVAGDESCRLSGVGLIRLKCDDQFLLRPRQLLRLRATRGVSRRSREKPMIPFIGVRIS